MKKIFSNTKFQIACLFAVIIVGVININSLKSHVDYLDYNCPVCHSSEVLNYGHNKMTNETTCYCTHCKTKFQIED